MRPRFDVIGLGTVSVEDLLFLEDAPPSDGKMPVLKRERHCGGLSATALVAASRLGARCAYAGTLGHDELSNFLLDRLQSKKVSLRHVVFQPGARPFHSTIFVNQRRRTRSILYDASGVIGAHPHRPAGSVIRQTRVLLVDQAGMEGMIRAARIACAAGIPVVGDLERNLSPRLRLLAYLSDHLIVPWQFAATLSGAADPSAAVRRLMSRNRKAVVITRGERGCWFASNTNPSPKHCPDFRVRVVDTTGCGDVFHGAYAAALARGMEMRERIEFASAAAALKATRPGGQAGIPTLREVEIFLRKNRR